MRLPPLVYSNISTVLFRAAQVEELTHHHNSHYVRQLPYLGPVDGAISPRGFNDNFNSTFVQRLNVRERNIPSL
jgi:hypothetical protein